METVNITTPMIQLDQFLKWASILQSGGEIRFLLDEKKNFCKWNFMHCETQKTLSWRQS